MQTIELSYQGLTYITSPTERMFMSLALKALLSCVLTISAILVGATTFMLSIYVLHTYYWSFIPSISFETAFIFFGVIFMGGTFCYFLTKMAKEIEEL